MLASHTSIRHLFSKCLSQYEKLRKKQAFLDNYRKFPMFAVSFHPNYYNSCFSTIFCQISAIHLCYSLIPFISTSIEAMLDLKLWFVINRKMDLFQLASPKQLGVMALLSWAEQNYCISFSSWQILNFDFLFPIFIFSTTDALGGSIIML